MDTPRVLLSVPLYIILPCHPITGSKRHLLINANLEKLGDSHVRMKVCWTITDPLLTYQGAEEVPTVWNARVPGTTVFVPPNIFASPIYIVVSHVGGQCIHPGLLAAIFVTDWYWGATEGIEVDTDIKLLSPTRITQSTRLDLQGMDVDDGDVLRRYRANLRRSTGRDTHRADDTPTSTEANAPHSPSSQDLEIGEGVMSEGLSRGVSDDDETLEEQHHTYGASATPALRFQGM